VEKKRKLKLMSKKEILIIIKASKKKQVMFKIII
jgi:hypothetical protein